MADCLFCAIAAGDIPSTKVYEDDRTFAFLDINPLRKGHALVIPKTHAAKLEDTDPADAAALIQAARRLAPALAAATGDEDATLAINNGPAAGQEVQHLHLHIVPRTASDGIGPIHALFLPHRKDDDHDLDALAADVTAALEATA